MSRQGPWWLTVFSVLVLAARPSAGCQTPPEPDPDPSSGCQLQAQLVAATDIVRGGEPFDVLLTLTNSPPVNYVPPPFLHDRIFDIVADGCVDIDGDGTCEGPIGCEQPDGTWVGGAPSDVVDGTRVVLLDDAWAPSGDDPTITTQRFTFVPREPATSYTVQVDITMTLGLGRTVTCHLATCVPGDPDPGDDPIPSAAFDDPVLADEGGSVVPFSLRVNRNGVAPDRPLTVRVLPQNLFDPEDIFPLSPPGISTTGITVVGSEEELITFECGLHFPCFVGAHNDYHVTIHDGPTLLWDSSWTGRPLGRATVDRAPLARIDFVALENGSCSDELLSCSEGTLHLRLFARNPFYGVDMENVVLELPLPEGLSVASTELHHHDNPLDAYTPTPAELAATGVEEIEPALYRVSTARIAPRAVPATPPPVFADLFEVELRLNLPSGGLGSVDALVFDGLRIVGEVLGETHEEVATALVVPVIATPPPEISPAGASTPLLVGRDDRITWASCDGVAVESFQLYRGTLAELRAASTGTCLASDLLEPVHVDPGRPGTAEAWFYLAAGESCLGGGTLGQDSFGAQRASAAGCP